MQRELFLKVVEARQGLLSIGSHSDYIGEPLRGLIMPGDIYDLKASLVAGEGGKYWSR